MPIPNFFYSTVRGPRWLEPRINRRRRHQIHIRHLPPESSGSEFRGGGGIDLSDLSAWFNEENYTLSALFWMWLPNEQVRTGVYHFRPHAQFEGLFKANTRGRAIFEKPTLVCNLSLSYKLFVGDRTVSLPSIEHTIVDFRRRNNARIEKEFRREPFLFADYQHIVSESESNQTIGMEFRIDLRFRRDSSGHFFFFPLEDEDFFKIAMPRPLLNYSEEGFLI